jgi:hypothetical protein
MTGLGGLCLSAGIGWAAAGNAAGERGQGDASDQGAAFHETLVIPIKVPMSVF